MARRARQRDDGAAAVEFALLLPVFAMLAIGIITFGFAFESWINLTQAARETSRFGATYPVASSSTGDIDGWLDDMGKVAAENAGITLSGAGATPLADYFICVGFVNQQGSGTPTSKLKTWGTLDTETVSCTGSGLPDNRVEVEVKKPAPVSWVLGAANLQVEGRNTSRYEPKLDE